MAAALVDYADLLDALTENDHYSLPFAAQPTRLDLSDGLRMMRTSIEAANTASEVRRPGDSTWCSEPFVGLKSIVAEISKGTMEPDEIQLWLEDLNSALIDAGFTGRVVAHRPRKRLTNKPAIDGLPPAVTAYLAFRPSKDGDLDSPMEASFFRELSGRMTDWLRLPGSSIEIHNGMAFFACPKSKVRDQLGSEAFDPQRGVREFTLHPPRLRMFDFSFSRMGAVQTASVSATPLDLLQECIEGLTIFADYLDYACVRRAAPNVPGDINKTWTLERPATEGETLASWRGRQALNRLVPDVFVAQVLTPEHLALSPDLTGFELTEVAASRHLVVASEPEPWLAGLNPDVETVDAARRRWAPLLLTEERLAEGH